jgi:hypothetical protein
LIARLTERLTIVLFLAMLEAVFSTLDRVESLRLEALDNAITCSDGLDSCKIEEVED